MIQKSEPMLTTNDAHHLSAANRAILFSFNFKEFRARTEVPFTTLDNLLAYSIQLASLSDDESDESANHVTVNQQPLTSAYDYS